MNIHRWWLYVVECEGGFFYVGISTNVESRFIKHKNGQGAHFTRRHKPVRIIKRLPLGEIPQKEAEKYEDAATLEMIFKLTSAKVAGGRFFNHKASKKKHRREYAKIDSFYKNKLKKLPRPPKENRRPAFDISAAKRELRAAHKALGF